MESIRSALAEVRNQSTSTANSLSSVVQVLTRIADKVAPVKSSLDGIMIGLKPLTNSKFAKGVKALQKLFKTIQGSVFGSEAISAIMALMDPFVELFDLLLIPLEVIGGILAISLVPLFQILAPLMAELATWLMANQEIIATLINIVIIVVGVIALLVGAFNPVTLVIMIVIGAVVLLIKYWKEISGVILWIAGLIKNVFFVQFAAIFNALAFIWNTVLKPMFDGMILVWDLLAVFWKTVLQPIFKALLDGLGIVGDGFKAFINGLIDMVNLFIDLLNAIPFVDIPKLTKLATGGIVTSPTIAMIGEAGPEAVVPLNQAGGALGANEELLQQTVDRLEILIDMKQQKRMWGF